MVSLYRKGEEICHSRRGPYEDEGETGVMCQQAETPGATREARRGRKDQPQEAPGKYGPASTWISDYGPPRTVREYLMF